MNKNIKKGLYLGGSTIAIGAIAASITLPILLSTPSFDFDYNPEDDLIIGSVTGGISGEDIETEVEDSGYEDTRIASSVEYQASFFLYQFEQEASLDLQRAQFQMDITNKMLEIKVEMDGRNDEETIDNLKEDILEIQERLEIVNNTLAGTGDQLDYDHYRFSTEYPQILQKEDSIRDSQQKVFDDYKNNFISGYPTADAGRSAWPAERSSKYNAAESDTEAVDYLVYRQISNDAVAQFRFKVNDTYRVQDYFAKTVELDRDTDIEDLASVDAWLDQVFDYSTDPTGTDRSGYVFTFLDGAVLSENYLIDPNDPNSGIDVTVIEQKREDKIYFLGNDSKDMHKLNLSGGELDELTEAILGNSENMAGVELMEVSHALINAKPNIEGYTLPWTVDSETIKKLYSFVGTGDGVTNRPYNWLTDIFQDGSDEDSNTDLFIKYGSGNSAGTIDKQGSLGIMGANEFVSTMVNGFGLGMIPAYMQDLPTPVPVPAHDPILSGLNVLEELKAEFAAAETRFFGAPLTSQDELSQALALKTEEEITNEFGTIFRNVFDPSQDGLDLYYATTGDVEVVVSDDHGIHITETHLIDDKDELNALISDDLKEIAKAQDTTAAKVEFSSLYSDYFTTNNQIKYINDKFNGDTLDDSFKMYYIENALTPVGTSPDHTADFERMIRIIDSADRKAASTAAREATDSKMDWYTGAIDSKLRNANQLSLNDIYQWTYTMSGGK